MWYTTYLRYIRCFSRRAIEDDARNNVDNFEYRALEAFGPARPFNPVENYDDQRLAEAANTDATIEERKSDLEAIQKARTKSAGPYALRAGLAAAIVMEVTTCIHLFKVRGVEMPERALWGLTLASGVFILTAAVVKHAQKREVIS